MNASKDTLVFIFVALVLSFVRPFETEIYEPFISSWQTTYA